MRVIFLLAESFDSINFSCLSCFCFFFCLFVFLHTAVIAVINLHAIVHAVRKEGLLKGYCHTIWQLNKKLEGRPVARIFYGWARSVDYTDQRAPEALFTRGVRGHAPPGKF